MRKEHIFFVDNLVFVLYTHIGLRIVLTLCYIILSLFEVRAGQNDLVNAALLKSVGEILSDFNMRIIHG